MTRRPMEFASEIIGKKVAMQIKDTATNIMEIMKDLQTQKIAGTLTDKEFADTLMNRVKDLPWGTEIMMDLMITTLMMTQEERAAAVEQSNLNSVNLDK